MTTQHANQNVYQKITDQIVAAIAAGAPRFEMPWHTRHPRPVNVASQKPYRGVNTLALWVAEQQHGYSGGTWGTYRQWNAIGGQVRKGERAATIVFFKDVERPTDEDEETKSRRSIVAIASSVFNADQVDGYAADAPQADQTERMNQVEAFVAATGATLQERGHRACYSPITDTIHMPERALFTGSSTSSATETFYSTLLHELTHWTGHPTRLNRDLLNRFGDNAYAMEELVAELGAAFLCADLGIAPRPRSDHAAYINGWLSVLRQDHRAIFTAASKASAASDYLFKLQPQPLEPTA